jgi:hypothetical protein
MKAKRNLIALVLCAAAAALAVAAPAKTDRQRLLGTWAVTVGTYSDGSLENELEMSFAFKDKTMTNPMDGAELAYAIDETAKTITATGAAGTTVIGYRLIDDNTLEFTAMKVSAAGKETLIVGDKAMFKLLKLAKK